MFEHVVGFILLGMSLVLPGNPNVKGDSVEVVHGDESEASSSSVSNIQISVTPVVEQTDASYELRGENARHRVELEKEQTRRIHDAEKTLREVFDARENKQESEIESRREEAEKKVKEARAEFRKNLSGIKDAKKKVVAATVDAKLSDINTKRTDTMLSYISKMQEVLDKIIIRVSEAQKAGADTSAVDTAVADARANITAALIAVNAQAAKTYVATTVTDKTLKSSMETLMNSLQADLRVALEAVKSAHGAVEKSRKTLEAVLAI